MVNIPDIRQKFGGSARIIVPKTMVVGKPKERLALVTSLDQEMYDSDEIAEKLDYENSSGVTHLGINLEEIAGRRLGECSVVLSSEFLGRFNVIIFSKELCNSLSSPKAVVAYSLGDQIFFCASGPAFLEKYGRNYFNK